MQSNQPLVSIAIPAYKKKFLEETIRSVLAQTYSNIELIIVNDQSPEALQEVVDPFLKDSRVRYYVNKENLGGKDPVKNWNRCLSYAKGEYFALLCDDDLYADTFVERMLALAERYRQTHVFRSRARIIDRDGKEVDRYASAPEWESTLDYIWHVSKGYRYQTISEFFYRREHLCACGGYSSLPLAWYADYLSIYRISMEGGIASVSDCLVCFRQSGENISSRDTQNIEQKLLASHQYLMEVKEIILSLGGDEKLFWTLEWQVGKNTQWALEHTPVSTLLRLYGRHREYHVAKKMVRHAIFHNHSRD